MKANKIFLCIYVVNIHHNKRSENSSDLQVLYMYYYYNYYYSYWCKSCNRKIALYYVCEKFVN